MRSTVDDREMSVTGAAKINMFEFTAVIIVKGQTACRTALGLCWRLVYSSFLTLS